MGGKQNRTLKLADVDDTLAKQERIADWQSTLQEACFDEIGCDDIRDIVRGQIAKAKEGDQNAIKFVMGHLVGGNRPIQINQTQVITDVEGAARLQQRNGKTA